MTNISISFPFSQVYYYMGVDALQESLLVDEMAINQALVSLSKALQCPLGSTISKLQLLRGRCLLLKGEEQNAIDCFRKALDLEPLSVQDTTVLRCLLHAILVSFTQSGNDTGQAIIQLEECLKQAEERYRRKHCSDWVEGTLPSTHGWGYRALKRSGEEGEVGSG